MDCLSSQSSFMLDCIINAGMVANIATTASGTGFGVNTVLRYAALTEHCSSTSPLASDEMIAYSPEPGSCALPRIFASVFGFCPLLQKLIQRSRSLLCHHALKKFQANPPSKRAEWVDNSPKTTIQMNTYFNPRTRTRSTPPSSLHFQPCPLINFPTPS
jgi:hypothetical protein